MPTPIESLKNQAEIFLERGEQDKARAYYRTILARGRFRRDVEPRDLFEAQIKLGEIAARQRKWRAATTYFKRALAFAEYQIGPISPEVVTALDKLALIYQARGEIQASREVMYMTPMHGSDMRYYFEGAYRRSEGVAWSQHYRLRQEMVESLLHASDPPKMLEEVRRDPSAYPAPVTVLVTRTYFMRKLGDIRKAERLCKKAERKCVRMLGKNHPQTLRLRATLIGLSAMVRCFDANDVLDDPKATAKKREERVIRAQQVFEEVKQVQDQIEHIDPYDLIPVLATIGLFYAIRQRYAEAQPYYEQVLALLEKDEEHDEGDLALAICNLAQCTYCQGKYDEAEQYDLRVLALREKLVGEKPLTGHILDHLVQIYEKQGRDPSLITSTKERAQRIREGAESQQRGSYMSEYHEKSYRF
jgi:tetratricopeptide (TPR) repeat protein